MTAIEKLWDKARDDPNQKLIQETLIGEITIICTDCGSDTKLDGVSGCYVCVSCDFKVCGDS